MKTVSFAAFSLAALGIVSTASAETWKCQYQGNWQTDGGNPSGTLGWKAEWSGEGVSWTFSGSDKDNYGESKLAGKCDGSSCTLTQTYDSGDLKGHVFTWKASYSDEAKTLTETVNTLKGTWADNDGSSKGAFTAKGQCKKQ